MGINKIFFIFHMDYVGMILKKTHHFFKSIVSEDYVHIKSPMRNIGIETEK